MSWRTDARAALKAYPSIKRRQNLATDVKITPDYGGVVVQHGATRVTENQAMQSSLSDYDLRIISAVELELDKQALYYNADARFRMIKLCYWNPKPKRISLEKAAESCGYSVETLRKWNLEILSGISSTLRLQERRKKQYLEML